MSAGADVGTGASITFSSGFFAQIRSISWGAIERESIETSNFSLSAPGANTFGNRTYIPGDLSNPGELTAEINFNPDTLPPIDGAAETVTLTFDISGGDTTAANWAGSGFMTSYESDIPLEDVMTATVTIKFSGAITRTAGA